jgi:hypothetical protein
MLAAQSRMFVGGDSGRRHVLAGSLLLTERSRATGVRRLTFDGGIKARTLDSNEQTSTVPGAPPRSRSRPTSLVGLLVAVGDDS